MQRASEKVVVTIDELRQAFALLSAAESGAWPDWRGPSDARELRWRIELLAILVNVVPRAEIERLDEVLSAWVHRFPAGEPVSTSQLKEVARGLWVRSASGVGGMARRNAEEAIAIVKSHPASAEGLDVADFDHGRAAGHGAERLCAVGLRNWFDRLENDPAWTHVRAIGLAERAMEIDKLYVELFAISDQDVKDAQDRGEEPDSRKPWRATAERCPVVSAATILARIVECCVVFGEPGSGKSTLVQWMAQAVRRRELPDFDLAVAISLNSFAAALERRPTLSLVEFFFETLEAGVGDWGAAADWLRQVAEHTGRCLLLLDGWDEVPAPQREAVALRIDQEERFFTTLITTRPLSAPAEFQGRRRTDVYYLAGLTPRAIKELVRNLLRGLGRMDLCGAILRRIAEPDLKDMAANPFLLGLLVRVLAHPGEGPLHTRADVYHQVVAWIQEQYDESKGRAGPLAGGHVAGLRSLSHWLLFEADCPRYLFRRQELAERLGIASPEPVLRSRLVNRTAANRDEYGFLHGTFQEYFAAAHAETLPPERFDAFLDRAMRSGSRFPVLEFAAGLDGLRPRCEGRALKWLEQQDRFGLVLLKIARLAAAGGWPVEGIDGAGSVVRDELWFEIETSGVAELWQPAVEIFAKLDPTELCRRACERTALPLAKILFIAQAAPTGVASKEGLLELIPAAVRDTVKGEDESVISSQEVAANRGMLRAAGATVEERWKAIVRAGAARDREGVSDLIAILSEAGSTPMLWQQAIDSLGKIGGRQAIDALVDVVTGKLPLAHEGVQLAVAALRRVPKSERVLDAAGRDTILRRIAMAPLEQPALESSLAALEGQPIREGAEQIASIAGDRRLAVAVRRKAIDVMKTVVHRRLVETLVQSIESQPEREVTQALLNLADHRHLPLSVTWLTRQIRASKDRLHRRRLLLGLVRSIPQAAIQERRRAEEFLGRLIVEALAGEDSTNSDELCKALVAASAAAERRTSWGASLTSTAAARQVLENFAQNPGGVSEGRLLLAVAVVEYFDDAESHEPLRNAFQKVLRLARPTEDVQRSQDRVAMAICAALARLAPAELLAYTDDCEPVQTTLRSWAIRHGWSVFDTRIVDTEGREVCRLGESAQEGGPPSKPPELAEILAVCTKAEGEAFVGYWFMVTEGGPCQPSDHFKTIYDALQSLLNERTEDIRDDKGKRRSRHSRGQVWRGVVEADLPVFPNWVAYLKRARTRVTKKLPSAIPLLSDLGLFRKRRR